MCSCCALPATTTSACVRKSYKVNPSSTLQPRPLILWYLAARNFSAAAAVQHLRACAASLHVINWSPSLLCSHAPAVLHCYHNGGHTPRQPAYRCSGPDAPQYALPSPSERVTSMPLECHSLASSAVWRPAQSGVCIEDRRGGVIVLPFVCSQYHRKPSRMPPLHVI